MLQTAVQVDTDRYAQCIEASKRIRWDIDKDVIGGRQFDFSKKFLPDGLSKVHQLAFSPEDVNKIRTVILKAYRWQYIISGVEQPRFVKLLCGMITEAQGHRINEALAPIL